MKSDPEQHMTELLEPLEKKAGPVMKIFYGKI